MEAISNFEKQRSKTGTNVVVSWDHLRAIYDSNHSLRRTSREREPEAELAVQ